MKFALIVEIKDGSIKSPRKKISEEIYKLKDGRYFFTLEKFYKLRSIEQNKSWFGIPYKILRSCFAESYGHSISTEFIHEFCKERFLPEAYVNRIKAEFEQNNTLVSETTGEVIKLKFRLTTTKLSTVEGMEYYKNMQKFGAEFFGVDIPDPEINHKP